MKVGAIYSQDRYRSDRDRMNLVHEMHYAFCIYELFLLFNDVIFFDQLVLLLSMI